MDLRSGANLGQAQFPRVWVFDVLYDIVRKDNIEGRIGIRNDARREFKHFRFVEIGILKDGFVGIDARDQRVSTSHRSHAPQ